MKAILSDRIYLSGTKELYDNLKDNLTYSIPQSRPKAPPIIIRDIKKFKNVLTIPIARVDLIPSEYEIIDKRVLVPAKIPNFNVILRDSQQEIYNQVEDNCILNAKVGFGKTISALSLIYKFQCKTLILVHTKFLLDQWISEIKKVFNIEAGILQGSNVNLNSSIVVSTVQTAIKHLPKIRNEFGMVIVDEAHRTPAKTFTEVLNNCKARYKIALTGTLNRKDGLGICIPDYFSNDIIIPEQENVVIPEVHIFYTDIKLPKSKHWTNRINLLYEDEDFINLLYSLITTYSIKGHKILFVSDRISLLNELYELIPNSVIITSQTKNRDYEISKVTSGTFSSILGISSIFKEGISINILSCLILGMLMDNELALEQVVGRIMRKCNNKLKPVIVDIALSGYSPQKQLNNRVNFYKKSGYKITEFDLRNDEF